jgi:hypothetical protein
MGLFFNHKCRVCGVKYPNNKMRRKRGWICETCLREENLAKRERRR